MNGGPVVLIGISSKGHAMTLRVQSYLQRMCKRLLSYANRILHYKIPVWFVIVCYSLLTILGSVARVTRQDSAIDPGSTAIQRQLGQVEQGIDANQRRLVEHQQRLDEIRATNDSDATRAAELSERADSVISELREAPSR
jgi:hypothetical protein